MQDLVRALPHLLMALAVIAAVSTLAAVGILTGPEVLPVIAAAGGFSLGGTVASVSPFGSMAAVSYGSGLQPAIQATAPAPKESETPMRTANLAVSEGSEPS